MTQRVNIQYSVELDNIQETVDYLYDKVLKRVDRLNQNMVETSCFLDVALIDEIDQIRLEMAEIDIQLADIDRIVKGYVGLKSGSLEKQESADETVTTEQP